MIEKVNFGDPIGGAMSSSDHCIDNCWANKVNCHWIECWYNNEYDQTGLHYHYLNDAFYDYVWG